MKKLLIITGLGLIFLVGCASYLGDRMSLNFVQIKAKQKGIYCYEVDTDSFCLFDANQIEKVDITFKERK